MAIGLTIGILAYLVLVPLAYLFWGTFFDARGLTFSSFVRAYGDSEAVHMVANSVVYGLGSTLIAIVLGTLLAYVNVRTDVPFKGAFFAMSVVPIILPAIIYAPAWIFLASPGIGFFNQITDLLIGQRPLNIYSMPGMIWVEGLHLSPIVFLLMVAAFRSSDPTLEESALVGGVRRATVFSRITLALVKPALASGALLAFVLTLESLEIPAVIGQHAGIYVFTSRIYLLFEGYPADLGAAGALGVGLMFITLVAGTLGRVWKGGGDGYQTVTGKAFRPRLTELGRARALVGVVVALYFLITVILPILILAYASLLPYYQTPSVSAFRSLSLINYDAAVFVWSFAHACFNSIFLGIASATVVMILTTLAAWFVVRSRARGRALLDWLAVTPLGFPGLVLGMGLSFVYLRSSWPIYGTLWILVIAYSTRFLPYGMRYASLTMQQIGGELEESAYVSGVSWWPTVRRIVAPLASPGILAGWMYVLLISAREFSSSVLLYNQHTEVLSIVIYNQFLQGTLGIVAALGVSMIVVLLLLVLGAYVVGKRLGVRSF